MLGYGMMTDSAHHTPDIPVSSLMFLLTSLSTSKALFYWCLLSSSLFSTVSSLTMSASGDMRFGNFLIPASHVFYKTPQGSAAFVNLRPIVPGHVLVIPERSVCTLQELTDDEYVDMWKSVRHVQTALKEHYQATAFNVAVQDGRAAGQSVPHVHVHILPRKQGDFELNDDIYDELEAWAPREGMKDIQKLQVADDQDRVDRTSETMAKEAASYRSLLESSSEL
jgi:bis(5'-adenosyl)-triphosphatase